MIPRGAHPPGQPFAATLTSSSGVFSVAVGGSEVVPTVTPDPDHPGDYLVEIAGEDIACPGPITIVTDGATVLVEPVGPCTRRPVQDPAAAAPRFPLPRRAA